jgi:hypothetical protein
MLGAARGALIVAATSCLAAGSAQAGNLGFKLERSFAVIREDPSNPATSFQNIYLLSFPLLNGLPDVGTSAAPGDKCEAGPDGIVDSTDAICDLFTDRMTRGNSFSIHRFNRDRCMFESHFCAVGSNGPTFGGPPFPLERDAGHWITVNGTAVPPAQNRTVIVGSHDPSYSGRQIRQPSPDCVPRNDIVNLPYHTMYQRADEILCGLEGVDWVDANSDGNPDTCQNGIDDGTHTIAVCTFDNVNDDSVLTMDNSFTCRTVGYSFGSYRLAGPNFKLIPGEAYLVSISPNHVTTSFLPPHF